MKVLNLISATIVASVLGLSVVHAADKAMDKKEVTKEEMSCKDEEKVDGKCPMKKTTTTKHKSKKEETVAPAAK